MSAEEIFAQRMRLGRLFDIYGGLLTAKQKQCLGLYFYDDLSLSEISPRVGVFMLMSTVFARRLTRE